MAQDVDELWKEQKGMNEKLNTISERVTRIETKLESIEVQVRKMSESINWAAKIFLGGLLTSLVAYIANGGLVISV